MKENLTRREFVKTAGTWASGAGLAAAFGGDSPTLWGRPAAVTGMSRHTLGRTGTQVSQMGIGCAPFGRKGVDAHHVGDILHRAVELGVSYIDVSPNYGNEETGFAEVKMGPTLREIRDRVFLVTKTEQSTYDGTWASIRRSMKRLQTDHLDLVHLHNFGEETRFTDLQQVFGKKGALGALIEAKRQGAVRFIGASGHLYPSRFHAALDTGEIDVLMNAVNFVVAHTYNFQDKVWSRARRMNVGLVAMKVLGGASTHSPHYRVPEKDYVLAIRYALSLPGLACAVIGVQTQSQLEQAATTVMQAQPLSEEAAFELSKTGLELAGTPEWRTVYGNPLT